MNISLNFNVPTFSATFGLDRDDVIKRLNDQYEGHVWKLQQAIKRASSNQYEQEIMIGIVNATINEFIYGIADKCMSKGYMIPTVNLIFKHANFMEKKIKGEIAQTARSLAGMNYHITKEEVR